MDPQAHPALVCPESGEPLDGQLRPPSGGRYPDIDGIPVLVPDVGVFMARHGLLWRSDLPWALCEPEPLVVDAPDPLTPHLTPAELAAIAEADHAPAGLVQMLRGFGQRDPASVCAAWGADLAPDGPALDLGCGVGAMGRRMALQGRATTLIDRSPRAVLLARDLLRGALVEISLPDERGGARVAPVELRLPEPSRTRFVVGDAMEPPLPAERFAWVHLGNVVDIVGPGVGALLDAAASLLLPGGLLTVSTPHDVDLPTLPGACEPGASLRALVEDAGLSLVDEADPVPWVVRQYRRGYRLLLADCFAARRPLQGPPGGRGGPLGR